MDQNSCAADESTALAISRQQIVGARKISVLSYWNTGPGNQSRYNIFVLYEVYRRSANRYMKQYFECLDRLPASSTEPSNAYGRSQEVSTREGFSIREDVSIPEGFSMPEGYEAESNFWRFKISHDTAVADLTVLDEILDKAKEQEKPPGRTVSPGLAAWTFMCSILAFASPHNVPSTVFKVGALTGALLFTSSLVRNVPRASKLGPAQHKIQGLIRSFEEGTMPHRDRSEVLISPLGLLPGL
ncbi:unnamed protein product [Clonostachys solani]|uniref:Uncharacterized protein n=1 Tax=Clonostachys solani TaxID=160281 RepID=A0A9N9Z4Y5_9HYPO|nr:unnamed protein product [Clonostachys solani]